MLVSLNWLSKFEKNIQKGTEQVVWEKHFLENRARIFKRLWSPGIDSME
jgi:hypothetical protein